MMKLLLCLTALCIGLTAAFDVPVIFQIGQIFEGEGIIDTQIQSAGPFTNPTDATLTFRWQNTQSFKLTGILLRGNERFDDVSVAVRQLNFDSYEIDVFVTNTNFMFFVAEAYGYVDAVPTDAKEKLTKREFPIEL